MRLIIVEICLLFNLSMPAQQSRALVINEVLFNPKPGGADYIEIYNRSQQAVDLKNILVANRNSNGQLTAPIKISGGQRLILPGSYCLLTADSIALARQYSLLDPSAVIELAKLPSMPDDDGSVLLVNQGSAVIDELNYSKDWHFRLLNNMEGISLERISVDDSTQKAANWHSASASCGYGTPGYRNSQHYNVAEIASGFKIEPEVFSPDNNGIDDYVTVTYKFSAPGYVITITIYDAMGRLVKSLVRNTLCGESGMFRWDGLDENAKRLSRGIYVFLVDCFNLEGKQLRAKKAVTLIRAY